MALQNSWELSVSRQMPARAPEIWRVWEQAEHWPKWNSGVAALRLDGAFAQGTWFEMVLPEGPTLRSQLVEVCAPYSFVDETKVGDLTVCVSHSVRNISDSDCEVVYSLKASGPNAQAIGESVSADFAEVLAALEVYVAQQRETVRPSS